MFGSERRSDQRWLELEQEVARGKEWRKRHFDECRSKTQKAIEEAIQNNARFASVWENHSSYWDVFVEAVISVANEDVGRVEQLAFHTSTSVSFGQGGWSGHALLTLSPSPTKST